MLNYAMPVVNGGENRSTLGNQPLALSTSLATWSCLEPDFNPTVVRDSEQ